MPKYRLTFNTLQINQRASERVMDGNYTLSEALRPFAEETLAEVIGNDFLTSLHGVTSFAIRFEAEDDETARYTAERAVKAVSAPVDSIDVARRGRRYESIL